MTRFLKIERDALTVITGAVVSHAVSRVLNYKDNKRLEEERFRLQGTCVRRCTSIDEAKKKII